MYISSKSSLDSYLTWFHAILMFTHSYLGTVSQLMSARTTVETHRFGSAMNRSVMDS